MSRNFLILKAYSSDNFSVNYPNGENKGDYIFNFKFNVGSPTFKKIGLRYAMIPYLWYNIQSNVNNHFRAYSAATSQWFDIYLTEKNYDNFDDVISEIHTQLENAEVGLSTDIDFVFHEDLLKISITLNAGYRVNFNVFDSISNVIGFKKQIYNGANTFYGERNCDINEYKYNVYVYCSLIKPCLINTYSSDLISLIPLTNNSRIFYFGDMIYYECTQDQILKRDLLTNEITSIRITLRNMYGEVLPSNKSSIFILEFFE